MERDFKGVWIPKDIWLNKELSILEKCLITEIDSLDNSDKGCFASNKYLSEFIGVSEGRCANIISDLKKREFIVQCFFDGRNRGLRLHENVKPTFKRESRVHENVKAEFTESLEHTSRKREHSNTVNNTGINTQDNKEISKEILPSDLENEKLRLEIEELRKHILDAETKERKSSAKKKERFEPPTVQDVENYFIENGFRKDAGTKAYNYYAVAEWRDSKGNQVKNWKQKMQAVWFKEENKIITNYAITNNTKPERTYGSAPEGKRGTHLIPIPDECSTSNERYEVEGFYYGDV